MSAADFARLPRNAAYRYEYADGRAVLRHRPRHLHAELNLQRVPDTEASACEIRSISAADFVGLASAFAAAFAGAPPYCFLSDDELRAAAVAALAQTSSGGDGPVIEAACF